MELKMTEELSSLKAGIINGAVIDSWTQLASSPTVLPASPRVLTGRLANAAGSSDFKSRIQKIKLIKPDGFLGKLRLHPIICGSLSLR